jgi:predicted ArsR family transcriptional regulator
MGPAPVRSGTSGRSLSGQRATVLERLQHATAPATVTALAEELGVHVNTVREHLDALVAAGFAMRGRAPAAGRGRPAWQYTATDLVEQDVRLRDYAGLDGALAGPPERTSTDAGADARAIGRTWGAELAREVPAESGAGQESAHYRTVALLAVLGFAPEASTAATSVALRRCPLLDVARAHPEVVCNVHLGIAQGALEVFGGDPEPAAMLPFAEPGACRLHLADADSRKAAGAP